MARILPVRQIAASLSREAVEVLRSGCDDESIGRDHKFIIKMAIYSSSGDLAAFLSQAMKIGLVSDSLG